MVWTGGYRESFKVASIFRGDAYPVRLLELFAYVHAIGRAGGSIDDRVSSEMSRERQRDGENVVSTEYPDSRA